MSDLELALNVIGPAILSQDMSETYAITQPF